MSTPPRTSSPYLWLSKTPSLKNAHNRLLNNNENKNNSFRNFKERRNNLIPDSRTNNVNPNNIIFFDYDQQKVYKIAPWNKKDGTDDIGILNEFIAYSILNSYNNYEIHVPKMLSCELIPDTKFALLVISLNPYVSSNTLLKNKYKKNNNNVPYYQKAINYLTNKGIYHNDLLGNLYIINDDFFIIDFEKATFTNNSLNKLNNSTVNKINRLNRNISNLDKSKTKRKYNYNKIPTFPKFNNNENHPPKFPYLGKNN